MTEQETKAVLALWGLETLEDAHETARDPDRAWCWWEPDEGGHPIMPDFPTDDSASVRLAEQMGAHLEYEKTSDQWLAFCKRDRHWYADPTLGAALLCALVAAREE